MASEVGEVVSSGKYVELPKSASVGGSSFNFACATILIIELVERLCFYVFAGSQEFFLETLGYDVQQSAGINAAFSTLCYIWPLVGGHMADSHLGRYRTIICFVSVYVAGMFMCSVAALPGVARSAMFYMVGSMGLITLGTGGIKPNISSFGADQYDVSTEAGRRGQEAFYSQFYVAINMGALLSYGGLTTLCSNGFPPYVPRTYGYVAAYGFGTASMASAVLVFVCNRRQYMHKQPGGNSLLGVILHVHSAARRGHIRAAAVYAGWPSLLVGVLLTVVLSFWPNPALLAVSALAIAAGLAAVSWGCSGDLAWVTAAKRNTLVRRQDTADFLRIMPVMITVTLAFNFMYNCMGFWYQQQACQMDLRIGGGKTASQLNGSFFNIADCLSIVLITPILVKYVNPLIGRLLGDLTQHGKLLIGCGLAATSVLWAAQLEMARRASPLLEEASKCAPAGVRMSALSGWWMLGPFAIMGLAEVYVNPTLYFLSYSQTPLRLRSTASAVSMVANSASSSVFTLLTLAMGSAQDLNKTRLEHGYFASVALAVPFLGCYLMAQRSFTEKEFDGPVWNRQVTVDEEEASRERKAVKEVAYGRVGFFKDFASPRGPAGSPPASPTASPRGSPSVPEFGLGGGGGEAGADDDLVLIGDDRRPL